MSKTSNSTTTSNTRNIFYGCLIVLMATAPASAFVTSSSLRPAGTTSPMTRLSTHNNLIAGLMRIEWVEDQVKQLQELEASVKTTTPPPANTNQVSLQMDYDLADAISEPRIDQGALQQKLRERLEKAKIATKSSKTMTTKTTTTVPPPPPIDDVQKASLQMDYDFADAISEPRIDPAELQQKLRARLQAAKQRKAQKKQPTLMTNQNRRTVQVVP